MGLLEKLGLREDPSAKLSEWLGERLATLGSDVVLGEVESLPRALSEIDERVAGFVRDHDVAALESAIDQWVDRTDLADVIQATRAFRARQEVREVMRSALARMGAPDTSGDVEFESALDRTGVLPVHALFEDLPEVPDPERALSAIWDAVGPFGAADKALREEVAAAANISPDDAGWHLLGLRYLLLVQASRAGKESSERSSELVRYAMGQIHRRLIGLPGFRGTARVEERLLAAATEYLRPILEPVRVDGVKIDPVPTTVFGRAFAAQCGAPRSIELRWACARETARLYPLLAAYAKAWFERN
jgi:hypothetical protein